MWTIEASQPWAWALMHGGVDVLNTTEPPPSKAVGSRVAVFASPQLDHDARSFMVSRGVDPPESWLSGCIVGTAKLAGLATLSEDDPWLDAPYRKLLENMVVAERARRSKWFVGPIGMAFEDAMPFRSPVSWDGCRGGLALPRAVAKEVKNQEKLSRAGGCHESYHTETSALLAAATKPDGFYYKCARCELWHLTGEVEKRSGDVFVAEPPSISPLKKARKRRPGMYSVEVSQPWAWAVARRGVDVLNRTRLPPKSVTGKRFAVYAADRYDGGERAFLKSRGMRVPSQEESFRWTIIATATVKGVFVDPTGKWYRRAVGLGTKGDDERWLRWLDSRGNPGVNGITTDWERGARSRWFRGPVGWELGDVVVLKEPVCWARSAKRVATLNAPTGVLRLPAPVEEVIMMREERSRGA